MMFNLGRLKSHISARDVRLRGIAKNAKISRESLHNKLRGDVEFKISELVGICEALHLTDAEFLELFNDGGAA